MHKYYIYKEAIFHAERIHFYIQYEVNSHSSISTNIRIITCGGNYGVSNILLSNCTILAKEGEIKRFPSMRRGRRRFRLGFLDHMLYAIGGTGGYGTNTTMESINIYNETEWTETILSFSTGVHGHCVATTQTSLVLTGGYGVKPSGVSSIFHVW